ncbi:MAG: hypothetical protein WD114_02540 [Phycisphaerales bacterium]
MLAGCLAVLALLLVIGIGATIFVLNSWRGWVSGGMRQGIDAVLVDAKMDEGERLEINAHVSELMDRFEREEVSLEELGRVTVALAEGPLLPAIIVGASHSMYFQDSAMTDEEKEMARLQLRRVAVGVHEKSINEEALREVLAPLEAQPGAESTIEIQLGEESTMRLRPPAEVTSEDRHAVIALATAKADEAGIEAAPDPIDPSDEIARTIAKTLGEDVSIWLPEASTEPDMDAEPQVDEEEAQDP